MACCHDSTCSAAAPSEALNSPRWRRALWIALIVNAAFFVGEIVAGAAAGSAALQADALDFFGDAANYAISLGVAGMALAWRSRAALAKGGTLLAFALWVIASTAWHAFHGTCHGLRSWARSVSPRWSPMAGWRSCSTASARGDANMRSVWICSRNDAVGQSRRYARGHGCFRHRHWLAGCDRRRDHGRPWAVGWMANRRAGMGRASRRTRRAGWRGCGVGGGPDMSVSEQPLVACCLSTGEYQSRILLKVWHASLFGNTLVTIWCSASSTYQRPLRRCADWSSRSGYAAPSWPLILISEQMRFVSQSSATSW